jgi:hypothetical protein
MVKELLIADRRNRHVTVSLIGKKNNILENQIKEIRYINFIYKKSCVMIQVGMRIRVFR